MAQNGMHLRTGELHYAMAHFRHEIGERPSPPSESGSVREWKEEIRPEAIQEVERLAIEFAKTRGVKS